MSEKNKYKRTSQSMDNLSFDETYDQNTQLMLVENSAGTALVRQKLINSDTLASYRISDKDDDASPNYYGFVNSDGGWYILKETVSAGADTYRYAAGSSDYTTNWTGRAALSYDYFYNTF